MNKKILVTGAMCIALSGCVRDDQTRTQGEGAAVGALVGALIGALVDGQDGAIAGALVGAIGGLAAGSWIANEKQEYANDEDFYDEYIARTATENGEIVASNGRVLQEISNIKNNIKKVKNDSNSSSSKAKRLKLLVAEAENKARNNQQIIANFDKELENAEIVLSDMQKTSSGNTNMLRVEIDDLNENIAALKISNSQLASLNPSLI